MKIITSLSLAGLMFLSINTLLAQDSAANCNNQDDDLDCYLMMNPSSLQKGEQAIGKSVGVFRTSATETERTMAAARTTGGSVTSVRSGQGNTAAAFSAYSAVAGGFRGEVEADDDVDAEESHSTNKYLKKLIQDNIYEECLAEVAKLSLTKRQTAAGRLTLAQEEQEEWNVAKAAANSSKRKAERELKTAQRETLEASANVEDIKRNARDAVRAPQQGSEAGQALAAATILYEKARAAYAASELEVKRRLEILAEARLAVADAVLDAIDFHNTAQKTIVEAALNEAKETEEEAIRAVEAAKADVTVKAARLRPAEQNFNAAKRTADQASKQPQQRNNDVLQAAAKAAKLEVSLADARALLARTETTWTSAQETLRRTSDVNAKEKVAKDAERAAIERSNAAQKVAELSEALRDVNLAEADFAAAAKVAARDALYATTVAKDVTVAVGVSARAKAEREAADNKRAADERAARTRAEKEAADRNRADAIARENVEAAFNNAIRTKTEAAWLAAKNIATTAYNASRENKTLFEEKKGIAHNKVAFFQAKRLFISCIRDAKYIFTNIPQNKVKDCPNQYNSEKWFKGFKDGAFNESFDDLRRYLYQVDINSDAYKKSKKDRFLTPAAGGGFTNCYKESYQYVFDGSDQPICSAVHCAEWAIENSVKDAYSLGFTSSYSDLYRKHCKKNIEGLESHSTRTAGTIWEEEVQWLLLSAKEVVNDSEAAIAKANGSCNIM